MPSYRIRILHTQSLIFPPSGCLSINSPLCETESSTPLRIPCLAPAPHPRIQIHTIKHPTALQHPILGIARRTPLPRHPLPSQIHTGRIENPSILIPRRRLTTFPYHSPLYRLGPSYLNSSALSGRTLHLCHLSLDVSQHALTAGIPIVQYCNDFRDRSRFWVSEWRYGTDVAALGQGVEFCN